VGEVHEAILWETEGQRVRCGLCPHRCSIGEGHEGICGVRRNVKGRLVALTYGRVSSIAVDPIEKKPVFHYFPGSSALSLGSVGCSMRCGHCQNWRISRAKPDIDGLQDIAPELVPDLAEKYRCLGVAFTYNEPVIWAEYVIDVAEKCRERGLYTVMVTNGYITPEGLDAMGPLIDVWRVDVKGITDEAYKKLCHVPSVTPVLAQAERAKKIWNMHVEVVTNVVPGINDSDESLAGIAEWIRAALGPETPWHITRFFPYLELADREATPLATLRTARQIGRDAGLHFVYLGNVEEPGGEDTTCPSCGAVVVRRRGHAVLERDTKDGACAACSTPLGIAE
jgi:pyruvate formate lyase activating enzyme